MQLAITCALFTIVTLVSCHLQHQLTAVKSLGVTARSITFHPAPVKQVILMALRGGKPGKQVCVVCQKAAQHCQLWVPPALTQAVPDLTAKPTVYWLCDAHHGQVSDAEIVAFLTKQHRSRKGKR